MYTDGKTAYLSSEDAEQLLTQLYGPDVAAGAQKNLRQTSDETTVIKWSALMAQVRLLDQSPGRIIPFLDDTHCAYGGTCWVYFGEQEDGQALAYKVYKPELDGEEKISAAKELQAATVLLKNQVNDPRIVRCREIFEAGTTGLRFRDQSGELKTLDAATCEALFGRETGGTLGRRVLVMNRIEGHEMAEMKVFMRLPESLRQAEITPRSALSLIENRPYFFPNPLRKGFRLLLDQDKPLDEFSLLRFQQLLTTAVVKLVIQAADVLESFHQAGLYHADIKPECFKANAQGICLFDLGNAMERRQTDLIPFNMVTPDFVCTQLFLDNTLEMDQETGRQYVRPINYRPYHDISSLGATLYKLLGDAPRDMHGYNSLQEKNPAVSALLDEVVKAGLDAEHPRFLTSRAFQFALECTLALQEEDPRPALAEVVQKRLSEALSDDEQQQLQELIAQNDTDYPLSERLEALQGELLASRDPESALDKIVELEQVLMLLRQDQEAQTPDDAHEDAGGMDWLEGFEDEERQQVQETLQTLQDQGFPVPRHLLSQITEVESVLIDGESRTVFVTKDADSLWWDHERQEWTLLSSEEQHRVHQTGRPTRALKRHKVNLDEVPDEEEDFDADTLGFESD